MEDFYAQCDPDKENLCLYGNPDGSWEVQLPAEEVPPELPEPALGINFARDGMQVRECETHLSLFTRVATEGIPDSDRLTPLLDVRSGRTGSPWWPCTLTRG